PELLRPRPIVHHQHPEKKPLQETEPRPIRDEPARRIEGHLPPPPTLRPPPYSTEPRVSAVRADDRAVKPQATPPLSNAADLRMPPHSPSPHQKQAGSHTAIDHASVDS